MSEKKKKKGPKIAVVPSSEVTTENLTAEHNIAKSEEKKVRAQEKVKEPEPQPAPTPPPVIQKDPPADYPADPPPAAYPTFVYDCPAGTKICWDGMANSWCNWDGSETDALPSNFPDVSYLPIDARYFGFATKDVFTIVDMKPPLGDGPVEQRQSSMYALNRVLQNDHDIREDTVKHIFLLAEKVGDAEGYESLKSRFKIPRAIY